MNVLLVVEDVLQEVILQKLIQTYRPDLDIVGVTGKCGNSYIKNNIRSFNGTSQYLPHIIVTDLDRMSCAPQLIREWIDFNVHPSLFFRIAEKEIDAWIMSDRNEFAKFIGVPVHHIPMNTQEIYDPKQYVINLARKSRKRIMKDIVPQGTAKQGPGYNSLLQSFVQEQWSAERAALCNRSLQKAIERLLKFLR